MRDRIRINGKPISKEMFAYYFWEVYNRLNDTKVRLKHYFIFNRNSIATASELLINIKYVIPSKNPIRYIFVPASSMSFDDRASVSSLLTYQNTGRSSLAYNWVISH